MDGLVDITDPEEMQSINNDDSREQEANNRRLAQAVNYMQQDGGPDSSMTYMDRIKRIDEALLKQLPLQGQNFDRNLYGQLQSLILQAKREYNEALESSSSSMETDEDDYAPLSFEEALERGDSEPASPTPAPFQKAPTRKVLSPRRGGRDDNVERVRRFKYGGPDTEPENWHKDFPPILPFPETLMMAHWASLKIDYDLARPKDSKEVETNVPLSHPALQKYSNLPLYESGSRFRLPPVSEDLQKEVSRYGTADRLAKTVDEFYDEDAVHDNADYAPRVFLEHFKVGKQMPPNTVSPSQVRRALASTPTRPRGSILRKPSFSDPGPSSRVEQTPRPQSRTALPVKRASPSFRRISQLVRATEAEEARISQAAVAKPSSSKPASTSKVASHIAVPPKRGPGRPRKTTPSSAPAKSSAIRRKPSIGSQPYTSPSEPAVKPASIKRSTGKRKPSIGSQPYVAPEPEHETPRKKRKATPGKTVNFAEPLEDDDTIRVEVGTSRVFARKGKGKAPASTQLVAEPSESSGQVHEIISRVRFDGSSPLEKKARSKAAAAGKAVKKMTEAKKKANVVAENVKGATRSGAKYTL